MGGSITGAGCASTFDRSVSHTLVNSAAIGPYGEVAASCFGALQGPLVLLAALAMASLETVFVSAHAMSYFIYRDALSCNARPAS